jgi:hypothetical protein
MVTVWAARGKNIHEERENLLLLMYFMPRMSDVCGFYL